MTTYGYRLFAIELRRGQQRRPENFSECAGEHYADIAQRLLEELEQTEIGEPKLQEIDATDVDAVLVEGRAGEPAFQVQELSRSDNILRGRVFKGTVGQHQRALGVPGQSEDVNLANLAAALTYRFILVFPETGTTGIAVVESIGRSCPVGLLARWLSKKSKAESRVRAVKHEERTGENKTILWWKLKATQLADEEHLRELIQSGQLSKIQLSKKQILSDRKREVEKFRLSAPRIEGNVAVEVGQVLSDWWERLSGKDSTGPMPTPKDGADQLAAIIGPEVEELDFDDGWIVLKDAAGTAKIRPNNMPDIFTYYTGEVPIGDDALYERARLRAGRISTAAQIGARWPKLGDTGES